MKISKARQERILSSIGLKLGDNTISYEESQFNKYISREYLNSERRQSDDIYRMFELTLLHRDSGLRIVYTTTESYYGDSVEYKVIDMFILSLTQKRLELTDVDFIKKVFLTTSEVIPFAEVDRLSG